jgi:hypothetical protein
VGAALTDRLRADGVEIHRIVRTPDSGQNAVFDATTRSLDCSRLPGGTLESIDIVYAVGGDPLTPRRWGAAKRDAIRSSRVDLVSTIARAIAADRGGPSVLVSMSAVGIYGERGDELLTEDSPAGMGYVADLCLAWEGATAPAKRNGVRVVSARAGVILGPGGMIGRLAPLFRHRLGARLGNGRQWMSWIARADAVEALVRFGVDETFAGPVNLTSPEPIRNREFTALLAAATERAAVLRVPRTAIIAAMGRRVANEFLLQSARVIPERLGAAGFEFALPDPADAIAASLAGEALR